MPFAECTTETALGTTHRGCFTRVGRVCRVTCSSLHLCRQAKSHQPKHKSHPCSPCCCLAQFCTQLSARGSRRQRARGVEEFCFLIGRVWSSAAWTSNQNRVVASRPAMVRPLTEEELCAARRTFFAPYRRTHEPPLCVLASKIFFAKLAKYIGHGIKQLIDRPDGKYCFRLHRDRVYYVSEQQVGQHARSPPRNREVAFFTPDLCASRAGGRSSLQPRCRGISCWGWGARLGNSPRPRSLGCTSPASTISPSSPSSRRGPLRAALRRRRPAHLIVGCMPCCDTGVAQARCGAVFPLWQSCAQGEGRRRLVPHAVL